jgi:diacylglycerol kinase family enzyme
MRSIGIVLNPYARGNRRAGERLSRFRAIVGAEDPVRAPAGETQLLETLAEFKERGIDTLAICGGDGSVGCVVTRALRVWDPRDMPPLLLLRAGTINNLARSIGIRGSAEATLAAVVEHRARGVEHERVALQLVRVNREQYGYSVGAGMIVRFLERYYRSARPHPLRAVALIAGLGLSYVFRTGAIRRVAEPVAAEVVCDGTRLPYTAYTLLLASTIEHLGLGVKPFHAARTPSRFHVLAGSSTPAEMAIALPWFYRARPARLASLCDTTALRMRVEFAQPQRIAVNGDLSDERAKVLEIEAGPRVELLRA